MRITKQTLLNEIIQCLNNEEVAVKTKTAIKSLQTKDTPESLLAIYELTRLKNPQIVRYSERFLQSIEYSQLARFLDDTLERTKARFLEKCLLDLIHRLRKNDLFKYILISGVPPIVDSHKVKVIRLWLENVKIIEEYCPVILAMPLDIAKTAAKLLYQINENIVKSLALLAHHPPPTRCLKILDILSDLTHAGNFPKHLFQLLSDKDSTIRSKIATVTGKFSNNPMLFKHFLNDEDSRVRANIIEWTVGVNDASIIDTVMVYLEDENNRVQANASKVIYEHEDQRGLTTLMEMLDSPDDMKRVSGAWAVGEVREITVTQRLEELSREPKQKVAEHGLKALEKICDFVEQLNWQIASLAEQLKNLDGDEGELNHIHQALTFLADKPKEKLAVIIESLNFPKFVELQMSHWIEPIDKKEMMLIALLAFAEIKETRKSAHALLVPTEFQRYVENCIDTLKGSDQKSKMSVFEQLTHASEWTLSLLPEINEERVIVRIDEREGMIHNIPLDELEVGTMLAGNLYTIEDRLLLSKNTVVTQRLLERIKAYHDKRKRATDREASKKPRQKRGC